MLQQIPSYTSAELTKFLSPKQRIVLATAGPLATSLSSIETYMSALPHARPWEVDSLVVPMPWRTEECTFPEGCKLKIGFILDDGVVKPQPPIARAIKTVVSALKSAGHEGRHLTLRKALSI